MIRVSISFRSGVAISTWVGLRGVGQRAGPRHQVGDDGVSCLGVRPVVDGHGAGGYADAGALALGARSELEERPVLGAGSLAPGVAEETLEFGDRSEQWCVPVDAPVGVLPAAGDLDVDLLVGSMEERGPEVLGELVPRQLEVGAEVLGEGRNGGQLERGALAAPHLPGVRAGAVEQRAFGVRDQQVGVDVEITADTEAGRALAVGMGRIERGRLPGSRSFVGIGGERRDSREEEPQRVSSADQGSDGRLRVGVRALLIDREARAEAGDGIDVGAIVGDQELADVGRQPFQVPLLAQRMDRVDRQRALPASGHAGEGDQRALRDPDIEVLQVGGSGRPPPGSSPHRSWQPRRAGEVEERSPPFPVPTADLGRWRLPHHTDVCALSISRAIEVM